MALKLSPHKVRREVAMNPVARAIARQKLQKSMLDVKIKLYMTDEGEQIQSVVQEVSRLIVVTMIACRTDEVVEHMDIMNDALVKLCEISENQFRWRKDDAWIIDDAMDAVILATPKLSAIAIYEATKEIARLENEERLNGQTTATAA